MCISLNIPININHRFQIDTSQTSHVSQKEEQILYIYILNVSSAKMVSNDREWENGNKNKSQSLFIYQRRSNLSMLICFVVSLFYHDHSIDAPM